MYQKITLASGEPDGAPGPLPPELDGLADESLADLSWVDPSLGYSGVGFWPVIIAPLDRPELYTADVAIIAVDPLTQTCAGEYLPRPAAQIGPLIADEIRLIREAKEVAGIMVGGVPVRTDVNSQNKVTGALAYLALRPALTALEWEAVPGVYADLTRAQVEAVGGAIGDHIQACHARSRVLFGLVADAVAANDALALVELDLHTGWPV